MSAASTPLSRLLGTTGIVPESESVSRGGFFRFGERFRDIFFFRFIVRVFTIRTVIKRQGNGRQRLGLTPAAKSPIMGTGVFGAFDKIHVPH